MVDEFGGLDAESFREFEDCGKVWLHLITFNPNQLPRRDPGSPGELLLGHETLNSPRPDAAPDLHDGQYRHRIPF